jgi:hypothetical protein
MAFPSPEGGWVYDQLREIPRGADPRVLVEWSDIIERKANERCGDSARRIRLKGKVIDDTKFGLDLDAPTPEAIVCVLEAIQGCLALMPMATSQFYGALMISLASEAERRDGTSKDSGL